METQQSHDGSMPIRQLVAETLRQMEMAGYAASRVAQCRSVFEEFARFAHATAHTDQFSGELTARFLAHLGYDPGSCPDPPPYRWAQYLRALRLLAELSERGWLRYGGCYVHRFLLPLPLQQVLADYEQECRRAGQRRATLRNRGQHLPTLLLFLCRAGVHQLSALRPAHLSDFLLTQTHHSAHTIAVISSVTRQFLRYLYRQGLVPEDLAASLPSIRLAHHAKIPTVWTPDEVERLLAQVDRGSPQGKRDYAILLLAARFGMRVGDIVRLRLEHLHWEEGRIEFTQCKTGEPLVLPLSEEVGWALIDYLRHGRPAVAHREVFLGARPPFGPFVPADDLHYLISKYRRRAGIFLTPGRPGGLHTLRHSLASRMLSQETPLPVIASVLGHTRTESAGIYTKVDLAHLHACALDPEEGPHA
jgi:site-specific recombinase XerD